ncbi:sigma-70 family RNA polymerase sigma factor [Planctomycetota bacterium]
MSESYNEIELLKSSLKGRTASFEVLIGRYQSLVCAITYGATLNLDKSEELAQDTFLLAWKNLSQLKDLTKFKAWLCRIAKSVIQNWLRSRQHDVLVQAAPIENATAVKADEVEPVEVAINKEQQVVVDQALECIPETYRMPLILYYRENKSAREVGTLIGLNENATRQRIARARAMLKDQVAAIVETSLLKSKPGKAFATGVAASLAGISIKGSTAAAAAGTIATGLSVGIVKIASIVAGLLVIAGVTMWIYHYDPSAPSALVSQTSGPVPDSSGIEQIQARPVPASSALTVSNNLMQDATSDEVVAFREVENPLSLAEPENSPPAFKPMGVLSGLITDAQTGEPVRDASIRVLHASDYIKTDANGFYHVDKISQPTNCQIYINSNDYVGFGRRSKDPIISLSPDQQVVRHFQLSRACKVAVHVVDVNGVGLKGVRVIPTSLADSPYNVINDHGSRHTDSNGYVLLGGFPPASTDYMITVIATRPVHRRSMGGGPGRVEEEDTYSPARTLVRLTDPNVTVQAKIVLERGETVHGYVEYSDGKPATDIKLGLQPSWWHCSHRDPHHAVQPDGTFAIPHVVSGTYDIQMATLDEDGLSAFSSVVMRKELSVFDSEPLVLQLPMVSPQVGASIRGRLYFLGDKRPDSVFLSVRSGKVEKKDLIVAFGQRREDYQGKRFSITGLEAGTYDLHISGGDIRTKELKGITAPITDLEVELEFATAPHLTGRVIDERTRKPVSDFQIRAKTVRGSSVVEANRWTSFKHPQGHFDLRMFAPGEYQVQVLAEGYAPCWSDVVDTDREPNNMVVSLTPGGTLKGRVVNQAGEPVDNAKVLLLSLTGDTRKRSEHPFVTEKGVVHTQDGAFTLSHVPEGVEAIKVVHPDYTFLVHRDIVMTAEQTTYLDDLALTTGGTLEGIVLDEQGLPLANETLCFCDAEMGRTPDLALRWATIVTDANGFYHVAHLPPHKCYVYRDNDRQATGVTRRTITPVDGETRRLDFGGAYRVTGSLTLQEGNSAEQRVAIAALFPMDFEYLTRTDDEGRFDFTGIIPGTYYLKYYDRTEERGRWIRITPVTVTDADVDLGTVHARKYSRRAMDKLVKTTQTSPEPRQRKLRVQLPLPTSMMQWTFYSRKDFLAGSLLVRITRANQVKEFVVFKNGILSDGWEPVPFPVPNAGEIYIGFQSSGKIWTATGDRLEIELHAVKDLDGIGELQTGILPAGIYHAAGTYALLMDEGDVPEAFQSMPQEVVEKMREQMSFLAVTGIWETTWPLEITNDQGWLEGEQRESHIKMMERLKSQEAIISK